jgi:hypothetical protein
VTTNIIHSIQIGPTVIFTDSLPKTRETLIPNDSNSSYPKQHTAQLFCRDEDLLGPSKTLEQKHGSQRAKRRHTSKIMTRAKHV